MSHMKDQLLAAIEDGDTRWPVMRSHRTVATTIATCLTTLRDHSAAAHTAITAGLNLTANVNWLHQQIEHRCWVIVNLLNNESSPRVQALLAGDLTTYAPHMAYAVRRLLARRMALQRIPLIVNGQVVAYASDRAEADRWLARFEASL